MREKELLIARRNRLRNALLDVLDDVMVGSVVEAYRTCVKPGCRCFCRFSLSDDTPDDSTLVVFRARLREERFGRLFDRIVKQAVDLGLRTERRKIIDATVIRADVALKNRAELLHHSAQIDPVPTNRRYNSLQLIGFFRNLLRRRTSRCCERNSFTLEI